MKFGADLPTGKLKPNEAGPLRAVPADPLRSGSLVLPHGPLELVRT